MTGFGRGTRLPLWFKLALMFVAGLVFLDWIGIEILLEIQIDGESFVVSLFRIDTYFVPLGLLLAWFIAAWIAARLRRSRYD